MSIFYKVFMKKKYAIILGALFACISFFGIFKGNTALNICGIIGIGVTVCGYFSALLWCTLYATNKEDGFIFQTEEGASAQNDILDIGTDIIRIANYPTYHCFPVHVFEQLFRGSTKVCTDLEFDYKGARFTVIATLEVSESFDFDGAFWQWVKKQCNIDRADGVNNMSNVFITQVKPFETGGISSVLFEVKSITFSK